MTDWIIREGWPVLLGVTLKSLALLALAAVAALALRRASAAARHLVWRLALVGLLLLPVLSLTLPGWQAPLWPRVLSAPPSVPVAVAPLPPPVSVSPSAPQSSASEKVSGTLPPVSPVLPAEPAAPKPSAVPWPVWAFGLWVLGAVLAVLPSGLGLLGVWRLRRQCGVIMDGPLPVLASELAAELGVRRPVTLLRGETVTPMTWGWLRPVVLLPRESGDWPEDRLRAVLLHELAHIARADWPAQMAGHLACALYWFHPGVWLAARQARVDGECACDDRVLLSGVPAPDYARHLLDVARVLRGKPIPAVVPMAQTSQIASRLRAILHPKQRRTMVTRKSVTVALLASAAVLAPLAALRPFAQAQEARASEAGALPSPANDDQPLPGGVKLQLMGVTEAGPSTTVALTKPWWDPAGTVLPAPLLRKINGNASITGQAPHQYCALAFKITSPDKVPVTLEFQPSDSIGYSSIGSWPGKFGNPAPMTEAQIDTNQGGYRVLYAAFPMTATQENIRVGVGSGPWTTTVSDENTRVGWSESTSDKPTYIFGSLTKTDGGSAITLSIGNTSPQQADLDDVRVVAVDAAGHERLPVSIGDNSANSLDQIQSQFDLPPAAIKSVRLETRPFHWVTFHNVPLRPRP